MGGQKEILSSKQKKSQPKKSRTAFSSYSNSDQVKSAGINNIFEQCGLGKDYEDLDFEHDEDDAKESDQSYNYDNFDTSTSSSFNDDSTANFAESSKEVGSSPSYPMFDKSIPTIQSSHRDEMLNLLPDFSLEKRSNEYLPLNINTSTTFLDSSDESDRESNCDEERQLEGVISDERENELLQSDEELMADDYHHDRNPEPVTAAKNFVICFNGASGTRTIAEQNRSANGLKRTTNNILQFKDAKKTKWNAKVAKSEPVRLFLDDIGFEIETPCEQGSEIDNSAYNLDRICDTDHQNNNLNNPVEHSRSAALQITVDRNSSNRTFQTISKEFCSPTDNEFPSKEDSSFKVPLPPVKRPPTRPKKSFSSISDNVSEASSSSCSSAPTVRVYDSDDGNFKRTVSNFNTKEDDQISISASSIATLDDRLWRNDVKEELYNDEPKTDPPEPFSRIQNWIQENPSVVPMHPMVSSDEQESINAVVAPIETRANHRKILFRNIPSYFQGLCYYHFVKDHCSAPRCSIPHVVSIGKFLTKALKLTPERLREAYQFLIENKLGKLYSSIHICLIKAFPHHKMQKDLISSINDFFTFDVDLFNGVRLVVDGLKEMGLSFLEAIESIVMSIGLREETFVDVLLELLTMNSAISNNWPMIKKIIRTKGQIAPKFAKKIFHFATHTYPLDRQLLLDIYEIIIKNKTTDLSQIEEEDLTPLRILAGFNENTRFSSTQKKTPPPASAQPFTRVPIPLIVQNVPGMQDVQTFEPRPPPLVEPPPYVQNGIFQNNQTIRRDIDHIQIEKSWRNRRNCDFSTGKITVSNDIQGNLFSEDRYFEPIPMRAIDRPMENSNMSAASSSTSSRTGSRGSDNEYVPQQVFMENRCDSDYRIHSSRTNEDIKLSPAVPTIGTGIIPNNYKFNISLHFLYTENRESVVLDDSDHIKLEKAVSEIDGSEFLCLLDKYKSPFTLERFIIVVIGNLRHCLSQAVDTLKQLLTSIGFDNLDSQMKRLIKIVFEVTVMNLIMELEKKSLWNDIVDLLKQFTDWDTLVSSQLFQIFGPKQLTHIGRYIYLSHLLCNGRQFDYAHRILSSQKLRLLAAPSTWPFFNSPKVDVTFRNNVLDQFLRHGYKINPLIVFEMHKYMLTSPDMHGYNRRNQQELLNIMLNNLITSNPGRRKQSNLKLFFHYLEHFYKVLDITSLRLLASEICVSLNTQEKIMMYEKYCKRGIYMHYTGEESSVIIRTDYSDSEINLVLTNFFHQRKRCLITDVQVDIELPKSSNLVQKSNRSLHDVKMAVKNLLGNDFNVLVRDSPYPAVLEIPAQELSNVLHRDYST